PEEQIDPEAGAATDVALEGGVLQLTSPRLRGPDVLALQKELGARGYAIGTPDGIFGPATDRALRAFQEDTGLPPSGVLNVETAEALGL
ncbi:MAG: peptidoglycan-binding domain-containing protein, partial [Pseudomonadota bacterium]